MATTSSSELIAEGDSVVGTVKGSVVGTVELSVVVGSVGPQVMFLKSVCPSHSGIPSATLSALLYAPVRNTCIEHNWASTYTIVADRVQLFTLQLAANDFHVARASSG